MTYRKKGIIDLVIDFIRKDFTFPENSSYTWTEKEVLIILDSISKHYPINGITLNKDKEGDVTVVLGINPLVAILKCFAHPKHELKIVGYKVYYDLHTKQFLFTETPNNTQVAVQSLLDARDCFLWERKMKDIADFEALLKEYQRISDIVDKFNISIFTLYRASDKDIQTIKERINLFV